MDADASTLRVACDAPMRKMVETRLTEIESIVRQLSPALRVELAANAPESGAPPGPSPGSSSGAEPEIVRLTAELFGARVVNVQRKEKSDGNR